MQRFLRTTLCFLLLATATAVEARIKLPKLISDGMVLQRDRSVNVWGWAAPGEKITVTFNKKSYRTAAGKGGTWKVVLPALKSGGPFVMTIKGDDETIAVNDVLVGDVWFCSGQSNMVLTMERVKEKYPEEITHANFPQIRNFLVPTYSDVTKTYDDLPGGKWVVTSPETILGFGAVAWFFAKSIHEKYKVPIGIINASVGGSPAEAWVSGDGLMQFPEFASQIKNFKDSLYMAPLLRPSNGAVVRNF